MVIGPLLMAMLASAPQPPTSQPPILVIGHPWAPFISPMGEPFRAHSESDDTLADWFNQADRNHDGFLTVDEMVADAERFFAKLDTNHDGQIDPDELARYEDDIAPDIQVNSRTKRVRGQPVSAPRNDTDDEDDGDDRPQARRNRDQDDSSLGIGGALQGAARYGLLNMPEPVAAADTNFDRVITLQEFKEAAVARFQLLDTGRRGRISLAQLEAIPHAPSPDRHRKRNENATDSRLGNPLPTGP
jgi:Ca2+-binding EF-hand superfamily protein